MISVTTSAVHITREDLCKDLSSCVLAQGNLSAAQALLSEALRSTDPATVVEFYEQARELVQNAFEALYYDDDDSEDFPNYEGDA